MAMLGTSVFAQAKYPYLDTKLSYKERVENLLSLLTPEEKVGLMMNKSISIDRLGIPSYNWWSEACHGVRQGGYTVYPQPIGMAAAFNAQLFYDVFSQVSDEARANWNRTDHNDPKLFNVPMGVIYYPGNPELTFWCPNVNIFRETSSAIHVGDVVRRHVVRTPILMLCLACRPFLVCRATTTNTSKPTLVPSTMLYTAAQSHCATL